MNLVKWFRKNTSKLMAVVVVVLMFGFIGGTYLQYLARRKTETQKVVAYFGENKKITNYDIALANHELEILQGLRADVLLRSLDLRAMLLGELLFSERRISPELVANIKKLIRTNKLRISTKQINDIYRRPMTSGVYWLLLCDEAQSAGVKISQAEIGRSLAEVIPKLFPGAAYGQIIRMLITRYGVPEEKILSAFGRLQAVLQYAKMMSTNEDVTNLQTMHNASWEEETIDVELVTFDSAVFVESQNEPTEEEIIEHFQKYKGFFPGEISKQNPYGFGYKLPDRVRLEYIAVRLDDVSKIITPPTQQEQEEYYQRHAKQFTKSVPSDPNDPNSEMIEKTKSYAEMAGNIAILLLQNRINSKAEMILQEAKTLTEVGLESIDQETRNITPEQLKKLSGDYEEAAEQLTDKYKISVYSGKTGLLSVADIRMNEDLGMLYLKGYGETIVELPKVLFAIDELGASELGPFDVPKPRMYENIGPSKDIRGQFQEYNQANMVLMRVIEAQKASEPESVNQTLSKDVLRLDKEQKPQSENIYSVREKAVEDLKRLAALETTKNKAEELIKLVVKEGWDGAIVKFNDLYGQRDKNQNDPNVPEDPNTVNELAEPFKLQNLTGLQRISNVDLEIFATQNVGEPLAQVLTNQRKIESELIEKFYSLVPPDSNSLETVPLTVEFRPSMAYYVIKSLSVKCLNQQQYEEIKVMYAYREDMIQSQNLAPVYFNPENILKRMNFKWRRTDKEKEQADANIPAKVPFSDSSL